MRWGVLHVKGWGPKSSVCPSKPRETKLFGGISRFEKKGFVLNSRSLLRDADMHWKNKKERKVNLQKKTWERRIVHG